MCMRSDRVDQAALYINLNMPVSWDRKLIRINCSYYVCVPPEIVRAEDLREGTVLVVKPTDKGINVEVK